MEQSAELLKIDQDVLTKIANDKAEIVNLSNRNLSDLAIQVVAYAIEKSKKVFSVNLADNGFTDAVCRDLCRMLSVNHALVFIDLSHNRIGNEGAELLAPGFLKENKIKTLYLNANAIGPRGCFTLSVAISRMTRLVSLDLSENPIGDEGMLGIEKAYTETEGTSSSSLQSLYVDDCGIQEAGAIAAARLMRHLQGLNVLHIEDNPISNEGARALLDVAADGKKRIYMTTGVK